MTLTTDPSQILDRSLHHAAHHTALATAVNAAAVDSTVVHLAGTETVTGLKTFTNTVRIQSGTPGFWLDETDGSTKGAYVVLDNGQLQIQRRATNFGAYEAQLGYVDIPTGLLSWNGEIDSAVGTLKSTVADGGSAVAWTMDTSSAYSTSGALLLKVRNNGSTRFGVTYDGKMIVGSVSGPTISAGTGSPEGVVTAIIGSTFMRTDGSTGSTLYIKESGAGNTGWVPVSSSGGGGGGSGTVSFATLMKFGNS